MCGNEVRDRDSNNAYAKRDNNNKNDHYRIAL